VTYIDTRDDLVKLIEYGDVGVELGVAAGAFSDYLLSHSGLALLFSIDAWSDEARGHGEAEHQVARFLLSKHGRRSQIVRARFDEAANDFSDGGLDFCYIDGYAHTGEEHGETMELWLPKMKKGAIIAGDDYCAEYPLVIEAVDLFCARHGLLLNRIPNPSNHGDTFSRNPGWFAEVWL
jgi:Methyltransferase domain